MEAIMSNGGSLEIETVAGATLTATMNGPSNIVLVDGAGNTAKISTYDVYQSNGIIHVVTST